MAAEMTPTADQVALAIVEASKATGADPEAVAAGQYDGEGKNYVISRARMYAAVALEEVFDCACPAIARLVGVMAPSSQQAYLPAFHHRQKRGQVTWFKRAIVVAIKAKLIPAEPTVEVCAYVAPPPYRPPPGTIEKMLASEPRPHPKGHLEPTGYRPPDGTIRRVIEDDEDDGPVLQRSHFGMERQREYHPADSKTTLRDMLRQAVENTARAQPKATDG